MKNRFLSPDEYIEKVTALHGKNALRYLNCLAFAFGETKPDYKHINYTLITSDPDGWKYSIETSFLYECRKRGVDVEPATSFEPGNRYFLVFGWYGRGFFCSDADFHIARMEPDGTIAHKLGWGLAPTICDMETLREEYPERYYIYKIIE